MSNNCINIGIFAGDMRMVYIAQYLLDLNYSISTLNLYQEVIHDNINNHDSYKELLENSHLLIGPIPFSKDGNNILSNSIYKQTSIDYFTSLLNKNHTLIGGNLPESLLQFCNKQSINHIDLLQNENITILNAIATAEGSIMEAISKSNINLHSSNCLVMGFGRCGKILANKLKALDAKVDITARSTTALAYGYSYGHNTIPLDIIHSSINKYDFIFNTIPYQVLDKSLLDSVNSDVTIIDIASYPGGVDFEYASKLNINAHLSLGLPGKVAPKTSARIIADEIIKLIN